jgi:hypothetical protein
VGAGGKGQGQGVENSKGPLVLGKWAGAAGALAVTNVLYGYSTLRRAGGEVRCTLQASLASVVHDSQLPPASKFGGDGCSQGQGVAQIDKEGWVSHVAGMSGSRGGGFAAW